MKKQRKIWKPFKDWRCIVCTIKDLEYGGYDMCKGCYQKTDRVKNMRVAYKRRAKREVLEKYSGKNPSCACCGEKHFEFLTIDHINGGGRKHRAEIRKKYHIDMYPWLKKFNYPKGFRVLCINCNFALGNYKYCPHKL